MAGLIIADQLLVYLERLAHMQMRIIPSAFKLPGTAQIYSNFAKYARPWLTRTEKYFVHTYVNRSMFTSTTKARPSRLIYIKYLVFNAVISVIESKRGRSRTFMSRKHKNIIRSKI